MEESGQLNPHTQLVDEHYTLRLFIAGSSPISVRAVTNLRVICEEFLQNRYTLEVIDAHQQPLLVRDENVTAMPMLIKKTPSPKKRLIGDFSDRERVLIGLGIKY
ncbi:circadian clock KaiB family protein [Pedobacter rhizosphaerae]|uniref:Circadian clock protein KaiB n=1 Tax=Pedobacter rhizosphaerae TaxID=390241 RepID=A0A1H9QQA5_9SPHI|nr:circadian clock KaiB family protein [Pedobacter rhizosphaerae]SER62686.1 circadian clock protein KaiB [Pedobacter rhizosphaerae]